MQPRVADRIDPHIPNMPADAPQDRPNTLIRNTFLLLTYCEITCVAACNKPPARGFTASEGKMADETEVQIDTRYTPSLHPRALTGLDGYSDETAPVIASATEALEGACTFLTAVHDYRAAAFSDPTKTEPAALLATDDFAASKLPGVTKRFDAAIAQFNKTIQGYERELVAPVKQKAAETVSTEIRAHLKAAPNRIDIVRQAMRDGDDEVACAALGGPPMLSGLTAEIHRALLREYHIARSA